VAFLLEGSPGRKIRLQELPYEEQVSCKYLLIIPTKGQTPKAAHRTWELTEGTAMIMLKDAVDMARRQKPIFLISTGLDGKPAVDQVEDIQSQDDEHIRAVGWFREDTLRNLMNDQKLALVVRNPGKNEEFKIAGLMEDIGEDFLLDGYTPGAERGVDIPQMRWRLLIEIDKITRFKQHFPPFGKSEGKDAANKERTGGPYIGEDLPSEDLQRAQDEGFPFSKIFDKRP
jgi:hypothetical protein